MRSFFRRAVTKTPEQEIQEIENQIKSLAKELDAKPKAITVKGIANVITSIGLGAGTFYAGETFLMLTMPHLALGALGVFAASQGVLHFLNRRAFENYKKDATKRIDILISKLVESNLEQLRNGELTEYILNPQFLLTSGSNVKPAKIMDIRPKLEIIFRTLKGNKKYAVLETIDISHAEMTDDDFIDLLAAGMGKFNTKRLVLTDNKLTYNGLVKFKTKIETSKSFNALKILDLRGNNLTGMALSTIMRIVQHLGIEEIDLSDNPGLSKEVAGALEEFVVKQPIEMPSLRKITLQNVGLNGSHINGLKAMISGISLLESLDLRRNEGLRSGHIADLLSKTGFKRNISLKTLLTDYTEPNGTCKMALEKLLKKKAEILKECGYNSTDNYTVYLLNFVRRFSANVAPIQAPLESPVQAPVLPESLKTVLDTVPLTQISKAIPRTVIAADDFIKYTNEWRSSRRIRE